MPVPKVAIVGRPNVGKSSILNWIARKKVSVVDPTAGVTRDRVTYLCHEQDRFFELVDTGGIGVVDNDVLSKQINQQIERGLAEATLILFVVDAQSGLVPLDHQVSRKLRSSRANVALVVNKADSPRLEMNAHDFHSLGINPILPISVLANLKREDLIKLIVKNLPPADSDEHVLGEDAMETPELKLAIVGRRNVGKSTLINAIAETDRMIVSEIAGTTRDSVDVRFELDGKAFVAIDTPGVRKKKSLANDIEFYGLVRAQRSVRRADVVLMVFDATQTISQVDKKLVAYIHEEYKTCIFVLNKWDLAQGLKMETGRWAEYLGRAFPTMGYLPIASITASESKNIKQLINLSQSVYKQSRMRIPTSKLNQAVKAALLENAPSTPSGRKLKIFYATQVATEPPTIVLKCNNPEDIAESWKRFLLRKLREMLPIKEVPIKLYFRARGDGSSIPSIEETDLPEDPDTIDSEWSMEEEG